MKKSLVMCDVCGEEAGNNSEFVVVEELRRQLELDICNSCLRKFVKDAFYGPYNSRTYPIRERLVERLSPYATWYDYP
jgi:ribosome-binding protein aMBF1 (putative translation factor)